MVARKNEENENKVEENIVSIYLMILFWSSNHGNLLTVQKNNKTLKQERHGEARMDSPMNKRIKKKSLKTRWRPYKAER